MTEPCPDCARRLTAMRKALAIIRRMAGGALAEVKRVLEEAL